MGTVPETRATDPRVHALRLVGRDVLDVLHRVSTNDLKALPVGGSRPTLFCDFRGRLLHRALVVRETEDAVRLLSDSPAGALAAFVDARVFREDVRVEAGPADVPASLSPLSVAMFGADERARIEAGLPAYGHEVCDDFNPFEAGVADAVHLAKGCYTGQESLQRLVTYGSVRRERVRFGGVGAPPAPQDVLAGSEPAGRLTSVEPVGDGWVALAIVRIAALESGSPLTLADGTPLGAPYHFPSTTPIGRG